MTDVKTNHLAGETSPYLLQHADNPVDWHPWGEEALALARREDKPILLSIGYSACHWCHVMAHESFEDPGVAQVMNDLFVNIKVDREERPDLDKIYQVAHSLLTQRNGGWPLTMFLTPEERIPFFGGTYFPRQPRFGLPGFTELLQRVADFYRERKDAIANQNQDLMRAMQAIAAPQRVEDAELSLLPLDVARRQLEEQYDEQRGGFGQAPKFPHPGSLERLLRHWQRSRQQDNSDDRALEMLTRTLERMALGGINDQIGGGFCRYSTDDDWMIPHFEKMLYDNGPLLALYSQTHAATREPLFARTAMTTADWVMREMQSPEGGYYSSLDADSEGEEGKFYVWTPDEVQAALSAEEYAAFAPRYGLDRAANFEGRWYPHVFRSPGDIAADLGIDTAEVERRLDSARDKLFTLREQRVRPGRDDKILTAWNALMIRGMAIAARHLQRPDYAESAERALGFIRNTLWQDGRLLATCKDGHAHLNAYLDDHVYLIDAILELLQVRWSSADMQFALELTEVVLKHFQADDGGFYFTADDHEALIQRPKPVHDDSQPAGNGVAARVLVRLGHLLAEPRYLDAAEATLRALWLPMEQNAFACTSLVDALEEFLDPGEAVILRGEADAIQNWQTDCAAACAPKRLCLAIPNDAADLPEALAEKRPQEETVAYICTGTRCSPPIRMREELRKALA
ncbi:thioredoxin domain-containing protein [Thiohalobacter thiocyanaticus]|uniref:Thioredoxin domain-containing protein n=1 Tax=Thiohalobacter thiocyanaticus TaxID=585455 RepID=A0A426QKL2_9GAMM|nr:thioredoxin domain-containing protein [Thiohalobacter thiocyanaticus]RRQ22314.1 thioredoxin domain-containing protein [Thiohalobacter thiocyanaticus]